MAKKLLLKVFTFWALLLTSAVGWGQCVDSVPTVPISNTTGSSTLCKDGTTTNLPITFTSSIPSNSVKSYQWQVQIGGGEWNDIANAIESTLSYNNPALGSNRIRLEVTYCLTSEPDIEKTTTSNPSGIISVYENKEGKITISASNTDICPGENVTFTTSNPGNLGATPKYDWQLTRNGNTTTISTAASFSNNTLQGGDQIRLLVTSSVPCVDPVYSTNTITFIEKPGTPDVPGTINITNGLNEDGMVCPNSSVTLSISDVARASSYKWTLPSGWTGQTTGTQVTVTTGAIGNEKVVKVQAINDCGTTENSTSINVGPGKPATPGAVTVDTSQENDLICEGGSVTLSVPSDISVDEYLWTLPTGWSIASGAGTNQIIATAGNFGQNGTASVIARNACLDSDARNVTLSIHDPIPATPGAISGESVVCPNTDVTYTISSVTYADSYIWTLPNGTEVTTQTTQVTFNSGAPGNDKLLSVIAVNECGESGPSNAKSIDVDNGSPDDITITSASDDSEFCPQTPQIVFSVPVDSKVDTFTWTVPSGWTITSGQNTNELTVTSGNLNQDGNITVTAKSDHCGEVSASFFVTVKNPAPSTPTAISGPTEVCMGSTNTFTVDAVNYATTYEWTLSDGSTETTTNPSINFTLNSSGNLTLNVKAINECGDSEASSDFIITSYDGVPSKPGPITSSLLSPNVCPPLNGVTFTVPKVENATSYSWNLPNGWNIIGGAESSSITVDISANVSLDSGNITVKANNVCDGGSEASDPYVINLGEYVVADLGTDRIVCETTSSLSFTANVSFNNKSIKIVDIYSPDASGTLPAPPNGKVTTFDFNYTPVAADFNKEYITIRLKTEEPNGDCESPETEEFNDEVRIYFRDDPTISFSEDTEICYNTSTDINFSAGTPNAVVTYTINGINQKTVTLDESGNASFNTGNLTSTTTYELVSVAYPDSPTCTENDFSDVVTITVNEHPTATLEYSQSNFCNSDTGTYNPTLDITGISTGGSYSGPEVLGLDANGAFSPENIPSGNYTITYTFDDALECGFEIVTADITIFEEVVIESIGTNQRVCEGGNVQLEVSATGDGLTYKWFKGDLGSGTAVAGATASLLTLENVTTSDAGNYYVEASGTSPCSTVVSDVVNLEVDENITIATQPANTSICVGGNATLSVEASSGNEILNYEWFKGTPGSGTAVGTNSASLDINAATLNDAGNYYVVISGPESFICSPVTSQTAVLTVRNIPTVAISGTTEICDAGMTDIFFTNGTPNAVVTYTINGGSQQTIALDAAGEVTLSTGALSVNNDQVTTYTYELVSIEYPDAPECSNTITGSTEIIVNPTPDVDVSFENDQVTFCNDTYQGTFTPTLTGSGAFTGGQFSSQGLAVNEETGAFTPANATAGEYILNYYLGEAGGCSELAATLPITIFTNVEITSEPFPVAVCTANSTQLEMAASGDNLSYQWFKVGATSDSQVGTDSPILQLNNATSSTGGSYYVIVSGDSACSPVTSEVVTVTVDENIVIAEDEQPQSQNICAGDETILRVAATASGDNTAIQYQWEYRATSQDAWSNFGATETGELYSEISTGQAGEYRARIDGPDGFSCDTGYSQIVNVATFEPPTAGAGDDSEACSTATSISIGTGATAENFSSFEWTTSNGFGTITNGNSPTAATYAPVEGDHGKVLEFTLTTFFKVDGEQICTAATDSKTVTIVPQPVITEFSYISTDNSATTGEFCETDDTTYTPHTNGDNLTNGTGVFSVDNPALTVNSSTGAITPNGTTPGDYVITYRYTVNPQTAGCTVAEKKFTFTIGEKPIADFSYENSSFCSNAENPSPIMATNAVKGKFSSSAGLVFVDELTGEINIAASTPGTYTVTNTIAAANGCAEVIAPTTITIYQRPAAPGVTDVAYCHNAEGAPALTATADTGATLNWYPSADTETSLESAPVPNTETVTETPISYWVSQISTEGCESERVEIKLTINPLPDLSITFDESTAVSDAGNPLICSGSSIVLTGNGATSYSWKDENGQEIGTSAELTVNPTSASTYILTGSFESGCTTTRNITIEVDEPTVPGTLTGPESVCVTSPNGTLTLSGHSGDVQYWEKSEDGGTNWISINNTSGTYDFTNLTTTTKFRAIVKSGVCDEMSSNNIDVTIDALPEGGVLSWSQEEYQRIFLTCEIQTNDLEQSLKLEDFSGNILEWEYRTASTLTWEIYDSQSSTLSNSDFLTILENNVETTIFRAKIVNGACENGVYSQTAILSVIPSDIKPEPVEVTPEVLCYGNEITLSSEIKYVSEFGKFEGGDFTSAGIKNNGWDFTDPNGNEINYNANADSGTPIHWHKTQPKWKFITADINSPYNTSEQWWNPRNDGQQNEHFAIAQSTYDSNMDTPPFNLLATDEAVLTFDQAYNLTTDASIRVVLLKNGSEYQELYKVVGPAKSGAQDHFGYGEKQVNQMTFDLGSYIGESNLRVRFEYRGVRLGDIWAVDNIKVPEGPQNVLLQWFYDDKDPNTAELEQIGLDNESTVSFTPRKIGWNDFEVKTALILDSNGDPCEDINNSETIRVFVFDQYTTDVVAETGECGNTIVNLAATITGAFQGDITEEFKTGSKQTIDGYTGAWVITGGEYTLTNPDGTTNDPDPVTNPDAIFEADNLGNYTFTWELTPTAENGDGVLIENSGCPPTINPEDVSLPDCTTLDFDGVDDYVDLGNKYNGNFFIEAWIRPFDRSIEGETGSTDASTGVIFSSAGFEISMDNLPETIVKNDRWYHIAVANNGDLWVDGIYSNKITVNGSNINNTSIGARYNANTKTTSNHFSGWIEELRIWNGDSAPDLKELRFMMNQRIKLYDGNDSSTLIEGEVVPNLIMTDGISSYNIDGTHNLDRDGDKFYDQTWGDLAGYYRLYSAIPDPDGLIDCATFDDNLKPLGGYTPDHSLNKVPGKLVNITTDQENTSPTPYCSGADDIWAERNTWARPDVWDYPNSTFDGTPITWNIARTQHNITSESKNIIMLGLLSDSGLLSINKDNPLTITHYLLLNGNIDLVGESQLLQDHGSILDNASGGWLQRDQQGKKLSFNYNYWSSPVSAQGAANNATYNIRGVLLDGTDPSNPLGIDFKDEYAAADGGPGVNLILSTYWMWKFKGSASLYKDWEWTGAEGTEERAILAGEGYTMKGTDGNASIDDQQNYTFKGKPHNGDITLPFETAFENYLVGNPFPSAIDANQFIDDNITGENSSSNFNGALYFWSHFAGRSHYLQEYVGGYATYTKAGGIEPASSMDQRINNNGQSGGKKAEQFIPIGQGFFVNKVIRAEIADSLAPLQPLEKTGGINVIFNNTQRAFEIEAEEKSVFHSQEKKTIKSSSINTATNDQRKIWLKFKSPMKYHRQLLVTADPNASSGFDLGYDAPLIEDIEEDMYWSPENYKFVIQGVNNFDLDQELNLELKVKEKGELTITIDELRNIPDEMNIFLRDSLLQITHDLREEDYVTESEAGTFTNRFQIVFHDRWAVQEPEEPIIEEGPIEVIYVNGTREIIIKNPELLEISRVYLNNMLGQQVHVYYNIPLERRIPLPVQRFSAGVYVVKVHTEQGIIVKKVILE
ncbi:Ig-like domain-containing protein [Salinimicrobium sediminilitoris]|uniref:Ig-like domain-containing protein n=1 Tax=Salinimicrobium sediminilitoris TaxID=2876715 RepID=UPI001E5D5560|nr:T9SS type A sorting domain-containing protein [Salinimicrobium sediminilitoris]MCC8358283.1 T9SS type A sorting domain-containing protein [Salinimicrobium sediminilitoris]